MLMTTRLTMGLSIVPVIWMEYYCLTKIRSRQKDRSTRTAKNEEKRYSIPNSIVYIFLFLPVKVWAPYFGKDPID